MQQTLRKCTQKHPHLRLYRSQEFLFPLYGVAPQSTVLISKLVLLSPSLLGGKGVKAATPTSPPLYKQGDNTLFQAPTALLLEASANPLESAVNHFEGLACPLTSLRALACTDIHHFYRLALLHTPHRGNEPRSMRGSYLSWPSPHSSCRFGC